ncbi:DUF6195 family protein [Streptomyces jumonjinensis]|uniref:DUF6195 family protein n=1 Tax=Streptomyces jumonjinensis TaxID=1945 RepID=UPI00332263EC
MTHPLMLAAAKQLVMAEEERTTAREKAFRTWEPRSVAAATAYAHRVLGDDARSLTWEVVGLLPFDETLQAVASLDTVTGQHLELHYSGTEEAGRIALRVSCMSCPNQRIEDVTSLEQLGRLLSHTPVWSAINPQNGGTL